MTKRKSPGYSTASRISVTATDQTLTNPLWKGMPTLILTNVGADWIYINIGGTATATNGYPIPPNTQQVITKSVDVTSVSVIGTTTTSALHAMASGEGV